MWGKHFASMYEGSMRGKGSPFFAVWGYVISHMLPNRSLNAVTVELNPGIVGFLIGEDESVVTAKIKEMCGPDPASRTKEEGGRRLVQIGEYSYRVVNGAQYRRIRNEEDRREYQRVKQAEYRARKKGLPLPGERLGLAAEAAGEQAGSDAIAAASLPEPAPGVVNPALAQGKSGQNRREALGLGGPEE